MACEFTFKLEEWAEQNDVDLSLRLPSLAPENWECPHDCYPEEDYCIFHLDSGSRNNRGITDSEIESSLIEVLEDHDKENQFLGASFGDLNLNYQKINTNNKQPIEFSFSEFKGELSARHAEMPPCRFDFSEFRSDVDLYDADFTGNAWFMNARFRERLTIHLVDFMGNITNFNQSVFEGKVWGGATFESNVGFQQTTFKSECSLNNSEAKERMIFANSVFESGFSLQSADVEDLIILPAYVKSPMTFSLCKSTIHSGRLSFPENNYVNYDFELAKIGDIRIESETIQGNVFEHLFFKHTVFDGFNFSIYREQLQECDWKIHTCTPINNQNIELSDHEVELIYNEAKNGANKTGESKASSEFFIKEMRKRRDSYENKLHSLRSIVRSRDYETIKQDGKTAYRYFSNYWFDLSSGYGERPSKVVILSVISVVAFSLLIRLSNSNLSDSESFTTSAQAFVTLVFGVGEVTSQSLRLIAAIEGFLGAFLIALFVFSLTRSVER